VQSIIEVRSTKPQEASRKESRLRNRSGNSWIRLERDFSQKVSKTGVAEQPVGGYYASKRGKDSGRGRG
jgi:hypothetical protein